MRDSKRHWTSTISSMSSHRGAGVLQPEDILPPTPTTPLATATEDASAADVITDVQTEVVTDMPIAANANTVMNGNRIGPIESVMIRGRGNLLNAETDTQAIGLVLTQPTPWPMANAEGDLDSRQKHMIYANIYVLEYVSLAPFPSTERRLPISLTDMTQPTYCVPQSTTIIYF